MQCTNLKKISLLILLSPLTLYTEQLHNPVLEYVDGIVLDGESFRDLLQIRKKGREIQFGIRNSKTGEFEGSYTYKGKKYSIHQLAQVEHELDTWLEQQIDVLDQKYVNMHAYEQELNKAQQELRITHAQELNEILKKELKEIDTLKAVRKENIHFIKKNVALKEEIKRRHIKPSNLAAYEKERTNLKKEYDRQIQDLQKSLFQAKEDYKRINEPYLERVRGTKDLLLRLTFESCQLHGRDGSDGEFPSYLLKWAKVPQGGEFTSFDKSIRTYQEFDRLLTDSSNFYADLIESCPKGKKQCEDRIKQQQQKPTPLQAQR